jgi:DNA-binding transcriptional regulator YiaG
MSTRYAQGTGRDLAAERVRKGLRIVDVARTMAVSKSRVNNLEHRYRVSAGSAERYLRAVSEASRETHE